MRGAPGRQDRPYQIRLKRQVGQIPAGAVGTVVEHWADGLGAEVEFEFTTGTETETVEFADMEVVGDVE